MSNNIPFSNIVTKINRGKCPRCNGYVRVLESEMSEVLLNPDGSPRSICPISYNCIGFCVSCQSPLYIDATSGSGYEVVDATKEAIYLHNKIKELMKFKDK